MSSQRRFKVPTYDLRQLSHTLRMIEQHKEDDHKNDVRGVSYYAEFKVTTALPFSQVALPDVGKVDIQAYFDRLPKNANFTTFWNPMDKILTVRCFYLDHLIREMISDLMFAHERVSAHG